MNITVFKNIFDTTEPIYTDVINILKRIKDGSSKELITEIRKEKDKNKRGELKKHLKSVCFSGKFSKRFDNCLLEHSGLIVLDIDGIAIDKLESIKNTICESPFTFSCFISPSGNGLKILVKIPNDANHHYSIFKALQKHFNEILNPYQVDESGKNVSRVCYESYDPELYYNDDSELWAEVYEEEKKEVEIEDSDDVIDKLRKWIDKKEVYNEGNRNNYIFKFSSSLCRYGVQKDTALSYIRYNFSDLPEKELNTTVNSAYKTNTFGVEKFTKTERSGKTTNINNTKSATEKPVTAFWILNEKGKVTIDTGQLIKFISANGYGIYRHVNDVSVWSFVRVKNMIVEVVDVLDIKRTVLEYIQENAPDHVFDELQMKDRYFQKTFLNALPIINIEKIMDQNYSSHIFFDGFYYEITPDSIEKKDYIDLDGRHIWKNQLCSHTIAEYIPNNSESDFAKFVFNAMGKDERKYNSIRTSIGYILHTFKKRSLTKIPYFCDSDSGELDGMPNGGSGKSIIQESFRYIRNTIYLDGKTFKKDNTFNLQRVSDDTQIVVMEDFEGDIKQLFVKITGDFETEKKGKDSQVKSFKESPKIAINSNTLPKGFSDSYARRMHISEFSTHYNENHTPRHEFDKDFFDDWDQHEWNLFYSWMFDCIQFYFKNGLIKEHVVDINYKFMIKNTGRDFTEYWFEKNSRNLEEWQIARHIVDDFRTEMAPGEFTEQKFYTYMRKMAKIFKWRYESKKTGINREVRMVGFDLNVNPRISDFSSDSDEDLPF